MGAAYQFHVPRAPWVNRSSVNFHFEHFLVDYSDFRDALLAPEYGAGNEPLYKLNANVFTGLPLHLVLSARGVHRAHARTTAHRASVKLRAHSVLLIAATVGERRQSRRGILIMRIRTSLFGLLAGLAFTGSAAAALTPRRARRAGF